jgi:hypothetical protein
MQILSSAYGIAAAFGYREAIKVLEEVLSEMKRREWSET